MKTLEYRTIDKTTWGPGPWHTEPDKRQWQDLATGFPCLIRRHQRHGNLCGYVGLPPCHIGYGKHYDDDLFNNLECHGGLSFADRCQPGNETDEICHVPGLNESDDVWWIGFDCHHSGDIAPGLRARECGHGWEDTNDRYRTVAYVTRECERLAQHLAMMRQVAP